MEIERQEAIRTVCPFRLISDDDIDAFGDEIALVEVASGTTIFEEGDPTDGLAVMLDGTVEIHKGGHVLAELGPGSVFGELSLFLPSATRTATARTSSPVQLVTWHGGDVEERLTRHDALATAIVADLSFMLAERVERSTQDVMALLKAAGTRLPIAELERFRRSAVS